MPSVRICGFKIVNTSKKRIVSELQKCTEDEHLIPVPCSLLCGEASMMSLYSEFCYLDNAVRERIRKR